MAVATFTQFPNSFVAGDTIRVTIGDSRYPSTLWKLKVQLQSATTTKQFTATVGPGTSFSLVIPAAESAKLGPGIYKVFYLFTETASSERITDDSNFSVQVFGNPAVQPAKSQARLILESMQAAYARLVKNPRLSVNFAGESFTNKNIKEFQDAIDRQQMIVNAEDAGRIGSSGRGAKVFHPL